MKQLATFIFACVFAGCISAQSVTKTPSQFEIVVSFGSMCCGTASDDFLKTHLKKFSKTNKVTIPAYKASGCGREGEYKVLLSTTKLKATTRKKYLNELKALVAKEEKKNRAKDSSSGYINLEYNLKKDDVSFCRNGIVKF